MTNLLTHPSTYFFAAFVYGGYRLFFTTPFFRDFVKNMK